jgi:periplasmic divalent cation tolerance protein
MTDKQLLLTTAPNREEAETIASELVSRKLAACVNLLGPVSSIYRWQGEVERSEEVLLLIKSTRENVPAIEQTIRELHSYEIPELMAFNVESGLDSYLGWIAASVRK